MIKESVCILIPTLNEEASIGEIVTDFKSLGYENILVIDGHSMDKTVEVATKSGATVVMQEGRGKGAALKQAFAIIKQDVVVLIDGDGTYLPSEVERLLEPIAKGEADHVIGNRFEAYESGAFTRLNLFGNKVLNKLFGLGYGVWLNDILSGYRAFTNRAMKELELNKTGFETEAEMTIECVKKDFRIAEVPVTYLSRRHGVATKLSPLGDGARIGYTIYRLASTYNPLFYLGLLGLLSIIIGIVFGIYIVIDYSHGTQNIAMIVFTSMVILIGFLLALFGVLGNLMVYFHREMMREFRKRK